MRSFSESGRSSSGSRPRPRRDPGHRGAAGRIANCDRLGPRQVRRDQMLVWRPIRAGTLLACTAPVGDQRPPSASHTDVRASAGTNPHVGLPGGSSRTLPVQRPECGCSLAVATRPVTTMRSKELASRGETKAERVRCRVSGAEWLKPVRQLARWQGRWCQTCSRRAARPPMRKPSSGHPWKRQPLS